MHNKIGGLTNQFIIHSKSKSRQKIYKAKQIKLIVSQAFFLGKPMRDAAFFVVANHNHN